VALKKRLATDASLRPLLAQYVPLDLDTKSPEWQTWARRFRTEGGGIPIIYIVRADGKMLYGKSGSLEGAELPRFLALWRKQTGAALSPKQASELATSLKKARKDYEDGDRAAAVREIAKFPRTVSYAEVMLQAKELAIKVAEEALSELQKAEEQLASSTDAFQGALTVARIQRVYRPMSEILKAARKIRAKNLREKKDLFSQAEQLDSAMKLEEANSLDKALRGYQLVVKRYPETAAAKLAQAHIQKLEESGVRAATPPASSSSKPDAKGASQANLNRARSYLRFARILAVKRPERAKEYLRKVIKLVPGSEEAKKAKELLDQ